MSQTPPPPPQDPSQPPQGQPEQPYPPAHAQPPQAYPPPHAYRQPPPSGMSTGTIVLIVGLVAGIPFAICIIALLIGILLPALGAARRTARRMQNSTQLREIHMGMTTHANSNKTKYPGLDDRGNILADHALETGNSGNGDTVEARYWVLLDKQYLTPEYAISPSETDPRTNWPGSGAVTADHYSYALLSIAGQAGSPPTAHGRAGEWGQTLNTQAIVASDRNTGTNPNTFVQSIHSSNPGEWKGSALWNDNHVAFEQTHFFETRYGNGQLNVDQAGIPNDNLFQRAGDSDAYMIDHGR